MQISVDSFNSKNKYNTLNIIDIRNNSLYSRGHIINAKNIPEYQLLNFTEKYLNNRSNGRIEIIANKFLSLIKKSLRDPS